MKEAGRFIEAPFLIVLVLVEQRFITVGGAKWYVLAAAGASRFVMVDFVGAIAPIGLLRGASC